MLVRLVNTYTFALKIVLCEERKSVNLMRCVKQKFRCALVEPT